MSKLIFFVDDDKMILNLIEYTLNNRQDYNIKTFQTGKDCLDNLYLNPNLVVLDSLFTENIEKESGLEILKKIKKAQKDLPVIILSNHEDETNRKELLDNGAKRFIPKNDYFIDTLMEILDNGY